MVDDALRFGIAGARALEVFRGQACRGDPALFVEFQRAERPAQEMCGRVGAGFIDVVRNPVGIRAAIHELGGNAQGARSRVRKAEGSCVGHDPDEEVGGDIGRDWPCQEADQLVDEDRGGGCGRVYRHDIAKAVGAGVVVDLNHAGSAAHRGREGAQAALAIAIQRDGDIQRLFGNGAEERVGPRHETIGEGHLIRASEGHLFAGRAKRQTQGQGAAHGIAIRVDVTGQQDLRRGAQRDRGRLQGISDHSASAFRDCSSSSSCRSWSTREPRSRERSCAKVSSGMTRRSTRRPRSRRM